MEIFTRESYLNFRTKENITDIIYLIYKDICKKQGNKPFPIQKFVFFFNMWDKKSMIIEDILAYYDEKFVIMEVSFQGKIITYL